MDYTKILTQEKIAVLFEKIAQNMERDQIKGSNNIISYAMKEAWIAGFEAGRDYQRNSTDQ